LVSSKAICLGVAAARQAPGNCEALGLNCYSRASSLVWPGIVETTIARIDSEIVAALRPAMATIPNAMLLCASSLSFVRSNAAQRVAATPSTIRSAAVDRSGRFANRNDVEVADVVYGSRSQC
jgi:hypothetical protein